MRDVTKATDRQSKQLAKALEELLERSREETERIAEVVDTQVRHQFDTFGVATQADLARLEAKVDALTARRRPRHGRTKKAPPSEGRPGRHRPRRPRPEAGDARLVGAHRIAGLDARRTRFLSGVDPA